MRYALTGPIGNGVGIDILLIPVTASAWVDLPLGATMIGNKHCALADWSWVTKRS